MPTTHGFISPFLTHKRVVLTDAFVAVYTSYTNLVFDNISHEASRAIFYDEVVTVDLQSEQACQELFFLLMIIPREGIRLTTRDGGSFSMFLPGRVRPFEGGQTTIDSNEQEIRQVRNALVNLRRRILEKKEVVAAPVGLGEGGIPNSPIPSLPTGSAADPRFGTEDHISYTTDGGRGSTLGHSVSPARSDEPLGADTPQALNVPAEEVEFLDEPGDEPFFRATE